VAIYFRICRQQNLKAAIKHEAIFAVRTHSAAHRAGSFKHYYFPTCPMQSQGSCEAR
jgi:hypothetical protein